VQRHPDNLPTRRLDRPVKDSGTVIRVSRRFTQRGQERRAQLIAYATERFATDGYHPTSVADIVDGIGVGKGVFYWYFDSKEELFIQILRSGLNDLRRRQLRAIDGVEDPVDRIELGIRAGVRWMAENPHLRRLIEFARSESTFAEAIRIGEQVAIADAVIYLQDAMNTGCIPHKDPEALAHGILGVTNQLTMTFIDHGDRDPEAVADLVVSICRDGFAGG
jgi:AcrR family transcriptional regulator